MDVKEYLFEEVWAIYQVDGAKRKFFGDSFFGPMWKNFPDDVEVPSELVLDSLEEVREYLG